MQSEESSRTSIQLSQVISHENDIMMEDINNTALEELNFDDLRNIMMEGLNNNVFEVNNIDELFDETFRFSPGE